MEVWKAWVNLNAFEDQDMYVWTTLQTIENGWDSNFFLGCSLFDLYAKCGSKQRWQIDYPLYLDQKHIFGWGNTTLLWLFSILILKVSCLVPLCVHKRKCAWKKYELNFDISLNFSKNIFVGVFWKFYTIFSSYCLFILYIFNVLIFIIFKFCCFEIWFNF